TCWTSESSLVSWGVRLTKRSARLRLCHPEPFDSAQGRLRISSELMSWSLGSEVLSSRPKWRDRAPSAARGHRCRRLAQKLQPHLLRSSNFGCAGKTGCRLRELWLQRADAPRSLHSGSLRSG